jgi:glycosyltransferase involved in cell wall biosynthesis
MPVDLLTFFFYDVLLIFNSMGKLIILPGVCYSLGGTLVTLALLLKGLRELGILSQVRVLVGTGTLMEQYLQERGYGDCLVPIEAADRVQFCHRALQWVTRQPKTDPLLLDNCVERALLPTLLRMAPTLRRQGRPIYHFFHDLALSYNPMGFVLRKLVFSALNPTAFCNSRFTASHIQRLAGQPAGIFYQPIDAEIYPHDGAKPPVPEALQKILHPGVRLILTPSRIRTSRHINDKNLRAIIPVIAHLRQQGHPYHAVIVGEDRSDNYCTQVLMGLAQEAGVADAFSIVPPTFAIADYYRHADVVLTLAPREPFGRVVVEAIACGVPVVGSNTGGIGEILGQCAPQWRVSTEDPIAAAETIVRIAADPHTPAHLADAQRWVADHCDGVEYARQLMLKIGFEVPQRASMAIA